MAPSLIFTMNRAGRPAFQSPLADTPAFSIYPFIPKSGPQTSSLSGKWGMGHTLVTKSGVLEAFLPDWLQQSHELELEGWVETNLRLN